MLYNDWGCEQEATTFVLQLLSSLANSHELDIVTKATRQVLARAKERQAFLERGEINVSEAELHGETARQRKLADTEAEALRHRIIESPHYPDELKQLAKEWRLRRDDPGD